MSFRTCCVAAAVAFLIAGFGTAYPEVEDIGQLATAFPDDGVAQGLFRDGDGFGTLALRPSGGDFTSLSVGGKIVSPLGADLGARRDRQDELNADYSSSTVDGGLFPATVTGFGSVDSLIMK